VDRRRGGRGGGENGGTKGRVLRAAVEEAAKMKEEEGEGRKG